MCEKKKFAGAGMGYCPIPRLGHDTADCIVAQQAIRPWQGCDTAKGGQDTAGCAQGLATAHARGLAS